MGEDHANQAELNLPRPEDRPDADVVLFDGQCQFCRGSMRRLRWWDCQGKLSYLSIHDPVVRKRWPDLPHERLLDEMCVIDQSGARHWGADAVRYLTRRLRRLWWLAPVLHIPGAMLVARPAYRFVARRRYLIAGKTECESGACSLHGSRQEAGSRQ